MTNDGGGCLCSDLPTTIGAGQSLSVFATFNGLHELRDASLVVPSFLPADGLDAP